MGTWSLRVLVGKISSGVAALAINSCRIGQAKRSSFLQSFRLGFVGVRECIRRADGGRADRNSSYTPDAMGLGFAISVQGLLNYILNYISYR